MTDKAEQERIEQLRKVYPNQIPAKELLQPDPKRQPPEVVVATFANCRIKRGSHA